MRASSVGLVLGGIVSIQFGAALAASLFDRADAAAISLLRLGFAAIVLVAIWRPRLRGRERGDLRLAALFGLCLGAMNWTFYEAIERIPLGIAVTIEFAGPLAVAVLGSRRRLDVLWAVLAGAGIVLLAGPAGDLDAVGIAFAAAAGVLWGSYIVLAARTGERFRGGEGLALAMVVAVLVPLPEALVSGPGALLEADLVLICLGVALLSSVIPYSLETEALRSIPKHVFGVLMSLEPGVAALAGFLLLSQELATLEVVAIVLVVIASAGATRSAAGPPEPG